jgi:hypothetical protein
MEVPLFNVSISLHVDQTLPQNTSYLQLLAPPQAVHIFGIFARPLILVERTVAISSTHIDRVCRFRHHAGTSAAQE